MKSISKPKKFNLYPPEKWIENLLDHYTKERSRSHYELIDYVFIYNDTPYLYYDACRRLLIIKRISGISEKLIEDYNLSSKEINLLFKSIFRKQYNLMVYKVELKKTKLVNGKHIKINGIR